MNTRALEYIVRTVWYGVILISLITMAKVNADFEVVLDAKSPEYFMVRGDNDEKWKPYLTQHQKIVVKGKHAFVTYRRANGVAMTVGVDESSLPYTQHEDTFVIHFREAE